MSLLTKLLPGKLTRQLVTWTVQQDLLNGRGNLHEDYPSDFTQEEKEDGLSVKAGSASRGPRENISRKHLEPPFLLRNG